MRSKKGSTHTKLERDLVNEKYNHVIMFTNYCYHEIHCESSPEGAYKCYTMICFISEVQLVTDACNIHAVKLDHQFETYLTTKQNSIVCGMKYTYGCSVPDVSHLTKRPGSETDKNTET